MKKIFLSIIGVIFGCISIAFTSTTAPTALWTSTYSGINGLDDVANAIVFDSSENINAVGTELIDAWPEYRSQGWMGQLYSTGTWIWTQKVATHSFLSDCRGVAVDDVNNIYVVGQASGNAYLNKYNCSGILQWTTSYIRVSSGVTVWNGINISSTDIYLTGYALDISTKVVALFSKYTTTGTHIWTSTYTTTVTNISKLDMGNAIISRNSVVYSVGCSAKDQMFWSYLSSNGVLSTSMRFPHLGRNTDMNFAVTLDTVGSVYIAGYSEILNPQRQRINIKKVGTDGILRWNTTYSGKTYLGYGSVDRAKGITNVSSNVYVVGVLYDTTTLQDIWFSNYDTNGLIQWTTTYNQYFSTTANRGGMDYANCVVSKSTNIAICGAISFSTTTMYDVYVSTSYKPKGTDGFIRKY